jgi:hypothetical protein
MTGIISQYFELTEEFYEIDMEHYCDMKDRLLFGVMHLFIDKTGERTASFSSSTE